MVDVDGEVAVSYNGEIYNFVELRRELQLMGFKFKTSSDTEVLINSYKAWGVDCVKRFVGMWAFALLDAPRQRLVLSRDRFGIKPLFYARIPGGWCFASEIKGVLPASGVTCEPDAGVVAKYLTTGVVDDSERTFFEGILRVPAASNLIVEGGWSSEPEITKYWELTKEPTPTDPVSGFRANLLESIRIHARSDVQVGGCLSGGLDSSAIVCAAEDLRKEGKIPAYEHKVFGYVPPEEDISEERYMRDVAAQSGADLTVVAPSADAVKEAIPKVIDAQDEPFGTSSIVAQYFVFQSAKEAGIKVMLDGQGADEVLAGYHGYFPVVAAMMLRRRRLGAYLRFRHEILREFGAAPLSRFSELANLIAGIPGMERTLLWARERVPRAEWLINRTEGTSAWQLSLLKEPLRAADMPDDSKSQIPSSLTELLWNQTASVSLPSLLRFEDRNSMAHSLEGRVPFLDHRLVEYAFSLPDEQKLNGSSTKHVLRKAFSSALPRSVLNRKDKIGFRAARSVTWDYALAEKDTLDLCNTRYEKDWFEEGAVSRLLSSAQRAAGGEQALWRLINVKLWLRSHW